VWTVEANGSFGIGSTWANFQKVRLALFWGSLRSLDFGVVASVTLGSSYRTTQGYRMKLLRSTPGRGIVICVDCRSKWEFWNWLNLRQFQK